MSPEILNPEYEFKVGTLNPKTFESGELSRVNDFLSNQDFFRLQSLEFAEELKWRILVAVILMPIDGGRWLPHAGTVSGNL